jgi:transcriptional regulator with XRE-family HTH domain
VESFQDWLTRPDGIATRLSLLRARAGLSGRDLAKALDWAQSKVSRIETGKQTPSPADIRAWAQACNAITEETQELLALRDQARVMHAEFRARMRDGQAQVQATYNELETKSRLIRFFELTAVPGLLQVPAYARRLLQEMVSLHGLEVDDVDAAVSARMQRQQLLYDSTKRFEFLLAEPVLRWLLCPPAVMRSQLDRLQSVIGLDHIRFGILPLGRELAVTPQNSFQVHVGEDAIVSMETFVGDSFYRGEDAQKYVDVLDRMWDEAVVGEDARELVFSAQRALPSG